MVKCGKMILGLIIVVTLLLGCFGSIGEVDEWSLWQHNAQNTGYSSDTILYRH